MPLCGPKLSMLCTVVSAWGLVQLGLTGVAFFVRSPALVEDIPIHELEPGQQRSVPEWMTALHTGYQQSALNCWIAALLYLVTLAIAGHQLWANHQNQEQFKAAQF